MANKIFDALVAKSNALEEAIQKQRKELKESKKAIAVEYTQNMTTEEKEKEVKECESILNNAKKEYDTARSNLLLTLKKEKVEYKSKINFARERMSFLQYTFSNSLQKVKNRIEIEKNILTFNREGIAEIKIDISKENWKQNFKEELKKQGINGENRIADNIIYQAKLLVEAKKIDTSK